MPSKHLGNLSGYTDDTVVRQGILEAQEAFLQKPFSMPALAKKVRETLDQPLSSPTEQGDEGSDNTSPMTTADSTETGARSICPWPPACWTGKTITTQSFDSRAGPAHQSM